MTSFRKQGQNAAQVHGAFYLEYATRIIHFRDTLVVGVIVLKLISTRQIMLIKSKVIRWAENMALMGEENSTQRDMGGKTLGNEIVWKTQQQMEEQY